MNKTASAVSLSALLATGAALAQTVPLLDDDVSFRVPVTLFGGTNYFLVDTGTSVTALDVAFRDKLGQPLRETQGHALYAAPEIRLGNTALGLKQVICLDLKMFRLISGEPCHGILGMDFMKQHAVLLDFDQGRMSIGGNLPAEAGGAWAVPLTISNQRHFTVPALVNGVQFDLLIDSADSSTVSLNAAGWTNAFPPGDNSPTHTSLITGVAREVRQNSLARVRTVELAGHNYPGLICSKSVHIGAPSSLGIAFLRRHLTLLDFPNGIIRLQPGKQFSVPEELDMSGLHLLRQDQATLVHSVDDRSPAANAGVKPGDHITFINGLECGALKMKQIRQMLKLGSGVRISLTLVRKAVPINVEFRLIRFL